jgi:hypothetical protein
LARHTSDALTEIRAFFRKRGKTIIPLTADEILNEQIARKLASGLTKVKQARSLTEPFTPGVKVVTSNATACADCKENQQRHACTSKHPQEEAAPRRKVVKRARKRARTIER